MDRNEKLEQAIGLGFSSIAEMEEHQDWLNTARIRNDNAVKAVRTAKANNSNVIDARNI